jgi:hypothetical protein
LYIPIQCGIFGTGDMMQSKVRADPNRSSIQGGIFG